MRGKSTLKILVILSLITIGISFSYIKVSANEMEMAEGRYIYNGTEERMNNNIQIPRNYISAYVSLPSSYGISTSKTVYNQGEMGCCWAMAGTSLFEYAVDKKENVQNTAFSPEHMLEKLSVNGDCGFTATSKDEGGYKELCAAYFTSGYGPVSLTKYPWYNSKELISNYDFGQAEYRATDIMYLPSTRVRVDSKLVLKDEAKNILKQSIYYYGAAMASMYVSKNTFFDYVGEDNVSYYKPDMTTPITNHSVLIVGWDDNWSKTKFRNQPKNDGAWLVRNSWGDDTGNNGYFWISYDEITITPQMTICDYEEMNVNKKVYNLDESGASHDYNVSENEKGFINVFEMENNEKLTEVTFFENLNDVSCQLFYIPIGSNGVPEVSRKRAISEEQEIEYTGYHTIDITENIRLNRGEKCGIMVWVKGNGQVSIGREGDTSYTAGTINPGESFLCDTSGNVTDFTEKSSTGNFSIKLVTEKIYIDIAECEVSNVGIQGYTGSEICPELIITYNGKTLVKNVDYALSYIYNVEPGNAIIVVRGMGDFTKVKSMSFTITNDLSYATIEGVHDFEYSGLNSPLNPSVWLGDTRLVQNTDYIVTVVPHYNPNNVDTYYYNVIGIGKYTGSSCVTYNITPADISKTKIANIVPQTYTGSELKPSPVITFNGAELVEDVDYTISYSNNINVGTATITITGKGNFAGNITKTFMITQ